MYSCNYNDCHFSLQKITMFSAGEEEVGGRKERIK